MPACPLCRFEETRPLTEIDGRRYFRCDHCHLRFLDPEQHPDPGLEKAEYDRHQNDPNDAGYRRFLGRLIDVMGPGLQAGQRGLDYGCGPGPALAAMLEANGQQMALWDPIYAPDSSVLQRRYDFITCTETAEHFHRPGEEFERLDALLKPGGQLGLMTRFQTDDARFAGWHYRRDPTHVVFYRTSTLRWLAQRFGWTVEIREPDIAVFRSAG